MIYEMRVYRCVPGRLPALLKRFENTTLKLWEKHGIKQAGFFTTLIGESNQELTYMLAWESLADREKKWNAFQSDPDWIAARAQERGRRPDRRQYRQPVAGADRVLVGEVSDRRIPHPMPSGLDHIVHAVRDLDAAAEFYRRAGFTVGARNRHAWGTHNHIVQFPGVFIELIAIGEPELIRIGAPGTFSFGAFMRDFLAREEGLAMLVLEGKGAAEDAAAFRAAGIGDFKSFNFEREAKRPDGSPIKVAFSLVFAADEKAPDIGYFTCQQHHPENFWNPAFQTACQRRGDRCRRRHGRGKSRATIAIFVSSFAGERSYRADATGISVRDTAWRHSGHESVRLARSIGDRTSGPDAWSASCGDTLCGSRQGGSDGSVEKQRHRRRRTQTAGLSCRRTRPMAQP